MLKIYKIESKKEYCDIIMSALTGKKQKRPLVDNPDFFAPEELLWKFYKEETGEPKWDVTKEAFPQEMISKIAEYRLKHFCLKTPFYVVVGGDEIDTRCGQIKARTFYEVQELNRPGE